MSRYIKYDPGTKERIRDSIYEFLYAPIRQQFNDRLNSIISKNSMLHGNSQSIFSYKGEYYSLVNETRPQKVNRLAKELQHEMNTYLIDCVLLEQETIVVSNFITAVLNSSNSLVECLMLFPAVLNPTINYLLVNDVLEDYSVDKSKQLLLFSKHEEAIKLIKQRRVLSLIT